MLSTIAIAADLVSKLNTRRNIISDSHGLAWVTVTYRSLHALANRLENIEKKYSFPCLSAVLVWPRSIGRHLVRNLLRDRG